MILQEFHDNHVQQVMIVAMEPDGSSLEARGIINGAFMLAYARNPSLLETFEAIRDDCFADIGIPVIPPDQIEVFDTPGR